MKRTEVKCNGLDFAEALTLLFIALKLCKVISWSWVWILLPIWISLGVVVAIGLTVVVLNHISHRP